MLLETRHSLKKLEDETDLAFSPRNADLNSTKINARSNAKFLVKLSCPPDIQPS